MTDRNPFNRLKWSAAGAALALAISACDGASETASAESTSPSTNTCAIDALAALPEVTLTEVEALAQPGPHCKVSGTLGREINFELLLPDEWNGKFVMGGGGGFVGSVVSIALYLGALQKGYATVGTDTGHRGNALDASWALNDLQRIVNFGHAAVHRTAVTAKALTADYYRKASARDLFFGCSRGGGQALMEAQRYPDDFDAIIAGAPAYDWTGELGGRNAWVNQAMYPDPDDLRLATITPEAQDLIGEARHTSYTARTRCSPIRT